MKSLAKLHIRELAALVCGKLLKEGVVVTLSGGACAEIYSNRKYVTGGLDFVTHYLWPGNDKKIDRVMKELGFKKNGRIFINEKVSYSIEFPPGPLGIGMEDNIKPVLLNMKQGRLSLLSPTDSVKDRLTGYFFSNDRQCLEQAMMICKMNKVNLRNVQAWARAEGQDVKYTVFRAKLIENPGRKR